MSKYVIIQFVIFILLFSCQERDYDPDQLTQEEKDRALYSMSRYFGRLPKRNADHENKFETRFDGYYEEHAKEYQLLAYHTSKVGKEYFLISREAPSVYKKYVATAIEVQRDGSDNLVYYKEVFRTWKFKEPEFSEKSLMLFEKMVTGEDLNPFYPQHSGKEEYIEFPDNQTAYDPVSRRWKHPLIGN